MKKRMISLFLCAAIILGFFPTVIRAENDNPRKITCGDEIVEEGGSVAVTKNKTEVIVSASLPEGVDAAGVQWQVEIADMDMWVNIQGATGKDLSLTYAMLVNAMKTDEDRNTYTYIRYCVNGEYSDEILVYVDASNDVVAASVAEPAAPIITDPGRVEIHRLIEPTEAAEETTAPAEETTAPTEAVTEATTEPTTEPTEEPTEAATEPAETEDVPAPASLTEETTLETTEAAEETTAETEEMSLASFLGLDALVIRASAADTDSNVKKTYNIVVNYVFEDNKIVADPYTANLAEGSSFSATVTFPTVVGYLPYVNDVQKNTMELNYPSVSEDVTINVVYKPTNVNYTVIHYQQNVNDDNYTIESTEIQQGLTGSQVPEVDKTFDGFYSLLYERPNIAADGSTEIEVYYDRYYYLMNFAMDGGYGTEPVYARYGAEIGTVADPTRAGYTFQGWTLDGVDANIPDTMPAESRTYMAKWAVGEPVNYTVVYWKENADDDGYSYWGKQQKTATAGSKVSGSDDIPLDVYGTESAYFTYNAARTETDVEVEGDGSTVVNVYYYRNTYTIYFKGISGTCAIEEHTHGTNCNGELICSKNEHTHDDNCSRYLSCTLSEHEHTGGCYGLTCTTPEHTAHTADCLICGKTEHTHSDDCLSCGHTHTTDCYTTGETNYYKLVEAKKPEQSLTHSGNGIYTYTTSGLLGSTSTHYYLNIGDKWYCADGKGLGGDTVIIKFNCSHTHTDACYGCGQDVHTHSDSCYKDTLHTHTDACYGLTCGQAAHTHTDACYTYTCGGEEHTHTDSCYRACTKLEHTHTNQCNRNSTDNVIYVVTAKYEQNIADVWPTADKFPDANLLGWSIDGISSNAVSKRVNMTSDLCDTSDGLKYASALTGGDKKYLYYMFESFDQTSSENGNDRKYYNGKYYDKSETYYQEVNSNGTWNQKQITGMTAVSNGVVTSGSNIFLYYTRNRHTFTFYNVNQNVKTVSDIMYEQPLKDYKDSDGNLLSSFKPEYPDGWEPNAYQFYKWYTTPECYDGTEYNFDTATMPDDDVTLYAKWNPVVHKVEFYLTEQSTERYWPEASDDPMANLFPHGFSLSNDAQSYLSIDAMNERKPNGSYTFVMWYYYENDDKTGEKKPFDPSMPINKDLTLYGEWSSNTLKSYTVQYVLAEKDASGNVVVKKDDEGNPIKVADDLTGSGLAGTTKTFDAKGGTDLYANYQEGYFPTLQSQSLLLDIKSTSLVITFEYVPMPAVPYTVKYVEKDTGNSLADDKVVSDNRKAVVTETFKAISGYMPDAYQKRLVVTADGENILYFYYSKDETRAYYKITHYTQNTDGETWTEYASSQAIGDIGTRHTASPMNIQGFTYKEIKYVAGGTEVTDVTTEGAALTADGLEINLYYVRNEYPYQVRYLEQGNGTVLHEPKNGTGKYGQVISESAIDIDGYDKVDPTSATLNILIDEGDDAPNINLITFYYKEKEVTINYVAVGPEGCGTVSLASEKVKVLTGTAIGSTATANDGFKFVGWFKDENCTQPVEEPWVTDNKIVPQKTDGKNVEATYYAKFEYVITSLTITKVTSNPYGGTSEQFIFTVSKADESWSQKVVVPANGSITINGLKVGDTYTVTEDASWAWRYNSSNDVSSITLQADATRNVVTVTNTVKNDKWLGDDAYAENEFNK